MKERPILFSSEMVRALLDGRKSQTRRVIKPQPPGRIFRKPSCWNSASFEDEWVCPYGQPGDRLWVRECWRVGAWDTDTDSIAVDYRADNSCRKEWLEVPEHSEDMFQRLWEQSTIDAERAGTKYDAEGEYHWKPGESPCRWRPSIHLPRWASRITLEITNVHVQRLQKISESDAKTEGVCCAPGYPHGSQDQQVGAFRKLWDSINKPRGFGWDTNPWVWVVEFKRVPA